MFVLVVVKVNKMLLGVKVLPNGLLQPDDEAKHKLRKEQVGESFLMEYKPKRNIKFHKKAFALIKVIFMNQDKYINMEDLRTELKLKSGWYQTHVTTKGVLIYIPKSMDFSSMDALEFEEIYQKFIDVALLHFVSVSNEQLQMEIVRFS